VAEGKKGYPETLVGFSFKGKRKRGANREQLGEFGGGKLAPYWKNFFTLAMREKRKELGGTMLNRYHHNKGTLLPKIILAKETSEKGGKRVAAQIPM